MSKSQSNLILTFSVLLMTACVQQPSEMQKALIEKQLLGCLTSVTSVVGQESDNLFDGITALSNKMASAGDTPTSGPSWQLKGELVTVNLKAAETNYSCDYLANSGEQPTCLLYTSPSPRDRTRSRMPSSA